MRRKSYDPYASVFASSEDAEMAWKAVKAAKQYLPQWEAFARMVGRNPKMKLHLTGGASWTDGNRVFVQVPMALGRSVEHTRTLCGKRDEDNVLRCDACKTFENVTLQILHEVAHIVHGTFAKVSETSKLQAVIDGINLEAQGKSESKRAAKIKARIESAPEIYKQDYLNLAGLISPYLPILVNAIEDTRVNVAMTSQRKGIKVMMAARYIQIFKEGSEHLDGSKWFWHQAPANSQALIAVLCETSEVPWQRFLSPEVVQVLDASEEFKSLCGRAKYSRNAAETYTHAVRMLECLRRLGFCLSPDDEEDEPDPEPEQGDEGESESEPSEGGDSTDEPTGQDTGQDSSDTDADGSGDDMPQDDDDAPDTGDKDTDSSTEEDQDGDDTDGGTGDAGDDAEADAGDDPDEAEGGDEGEADAGSGQHEDPGHADDAEDSGGGDDGSEPASDGSDDAPGGDDDAAGDDAGGDGSDGDDEPADAGGSDAGEPGSGTGSDASGANPSGGTGEQSGQPERSDSEGGAGTSGDYVESPDPITPEKMEEMGLPEEVAKQFAIFGGHAEESDFDDDAEDDKPQTIVPENDNTEEEAQQIEVAIAQSEHFDKPSVELEGLNVWTWPKDKGIYAFGEGDGYYGDDGRTERPSPILLAPALQKLRILFTENRKGAKLNNLKRGKVDPKKVGQRFATGDPRMFRKRLEPGKKDYFVCIGFDVSGSTGGRKLKLIKASVAAMAELMVKLGVKFAVYAHSGSGNHVEIFEVKSPTQPWNQQCYDALDAISSFYCNLDGHTLEYYRKIVQGRRETDKVLFFYTDGALNNIGEEYGCFTENVEILRQLGIATVGVEVGVNSGMTEQLGMDTVRIDGAEDTKKVVDKLEECLGQTDHVLV